MPPPLSWLQAKRAEQAAISRNRSRGVYRVSPV